MRRGLLLGVVFVGLARLALACSKFSGEDEPADAGAEDTATLPLVEAGPDAEPDSVVVVDAASDVVDTDAADGGMPCGKQTDCVRTVFITDTATTANLMGINGGDGRCASAAAASNHARVKGRKFRAWLSTPDADVKSRLTPGTGAYVLPSGLIVANDFQALGATLQHAIDEDHNGSAVSNAYPAVWTGTDPSGATAGTACANWATGSVLNNGYSGNFTMLGPEWTQNILMGCNGMAHLYCFEE